MPAEPSDWVAADVWAVRRGTSARDLLGRITVEPLDDVLRHLAVRQGSNGPSGPLTQYLLREGAAELAGGLARSGADPAEGVAALLSRLVGHERFVEQVLELSVHNMRRRRPLATDWYDDLLAYILRPQRHAISAALTTEHIRHAVALPFGEFARVFTEQQIALSNDVMLFRLPETIGWLFPDHPVVRTSLSTYLATLDTYWGPLYLQILARYGLRLRPGVSVNESAWTFMSLFSWEGHNRAVLPGLPLATDPCDGLPKPYAARACCWYICATCETRRGETLTLEELYERRPGFAAPRADPLDAAE